MRRTALLLLASLWLGRTAAPAAEPATRAEIVGDYQNAGPTSSIDLHLDRSGTYRLLWHFDIFDDPPQHGTWHLGRDGRVRFHGADRESRRVACFLGSFKVVPRGKDRALVSKSNAGFVRRPATPAPPVTPST